MEFIQVRIIFFPSDQLDSLIDVITSLAPFWLGSLSVTTSKRDILRWRIGCHIFYERRRSAWSIFHHCHCVFSNVSLKCLNLRMQNCAGCICFNFLHCAFSNVSSNCLPEWMHSHIGSICWTLFHCAFSNVS